MVQYYQNSLWFFLSLAPLVLAARYLPPVSRLLDRLADTILRLATWRNGLLGSVDEIPKFAVLRILLGILLLNRAIWIAVYAYPGDWGTLTFAVAATIALVAACLLILGLATQWCLILLCVFQLQIDEQYISSSTLGNDVAALLSLILFLTTAGSRISLDALLIRRAPRLAPYLLYFGVGDREIVLAKFLGLMGYWLICIYSLAIHLGEPAWTGGFAGPQILTNNYMSSYFAEFEQLFVNYPVSIYVTIASMWVMLPWYVAVLPFVLLGGIPRLFVIVWGLLFFSFSLFVLNLGWLAEFEFLFWAALFLYRPGRVDLVYDDKCNLCDRTVNLVKRLDLVNTVRLRPISQNLDWAAGFGLTHDAVHRDLHGYDERAGRMARGYDLYVLLARSVIVLMPLWPLMVLGRVLGIGPWIYRRVADNRIRVFGLCALPTPKPDWKRGAHAVLRRSPIGAAITVHFAVFAVGYVLAIPAPNIGWTGIPNKLAPFAHIYGVTPINVFNKTDLRMTENWFTLEREDGTLVPLFRTDGSREKYHGSDRVYFGGTLSIRRLAIDRNDCVFEEPWARGRIENFAALYRRETGYRGPILYRQYHQPIADSAALTRMEYRQGKTRIVCERTFTPA